jgi:hypothetical protein
MGPEIMSTRFPVRIDAHPAAVPPLDHVPDVVAGVVEPRVKLSALPTAVTVPDAFKVVGVIPVIVTGSLTEKPCPTQVYVVVLPTAVTPVIDFV